MRAQPKLRPHTPIAVLVALFAALAAAAAFAGPFADAEDPTLSERLDAARAEEERLAGRVSERAAEVAALDERARRSGARAMQLAAQVEDAAERSAALDDELRAAERALEKIESRLGRAVSVLSDRVVEIYKSGDADEVTVILGSDDLEDLHARAEYLAALNDSDAAITSRVRDLREQVAEGYREVAGMKQRLEQEARLLEAARGEAASARAAAEQRAGELSELLGGDRGELADVRARIAELEAEQAAAQAPAPATGDAGSGSFQGGPYAIPTYIVMCESGGNYSAYNPSSGAGGAYQIIPSTWAAYGGKGQSHTAPKAEQDRIAALIWADVGPSAWACA